MTQLAALKSAKNLTDLAFLLGFKASAISFILYKKKHSEKYHQFSIPKKHGGTRNISSPIPELKLLQKRLSDLLQNCIAEIEDSSKIKNKICHGFKRGKSIITNAKHHKNHKFVFNIDLNNFFETIHFGRVRGFFINDKNFSLDEKIATYIAQIACNDFGLPQGSPCSPVISNLIGHILDIHLVKLAADNNCIYTRYADDLSFSTRKPTFPSPIATRVVGEDNHWTLGVELEQIIKSAGFVINSNKTRMQYLNSRQEVTGLVVNKKVNIKSEYRHTVRAMVHNLLVNGSFEYVHKITNSDGTITEHNNPGNTNQLHGMLSFIDRVDLFNRNLHKKIKGNKDNSLLTSKESLYRRFLLFKEFYSASAPVIICEGKTDNVYISNAIFRLAKHFPILAKIDADGSVKSNVRVYKYSGTSTGRILGINGGTPELANFIRIYFRELLKFKAPGLEQPIIILVDNDAGAKEKGKIFSAVKDVSKYTPTGAEQFIHVTGNLYVVPTPLLAGQSTSMIEDFFDSKTNSVIINGKSFNPENNFDTTLHYGKHLFAEKVIKPNADKIDFDGFKLLLFNIELTINTHKLKRAK